MSSDVKARTWTDLARSISSGVGSKTTSVSVVPSGITKMVAVAIPLRGTADDKRPKMAAWSRAGMMGRFCDRRHILAQQVLSIQSDPMRTYNLRLHNLAIDISVLRGLGHLKSDLDNAPWKISDGDQLSKGRLQEGFEVSLPCSCIQPTKTGNVSQARSYNVSRGGITSISRCWPHNDVYHGLECILVTSLCFNRPID